jgi:hypothetical protein
MQITNGSVSHTFKPEEFGSRVIAFSFTVDPGEDAEEAAMRVSAMAERVARQMPDPAKTKEPTATPNPPVAVLVAQTPTPAALAGEPVPVSTEGAINDNQLKLAFDAARARGVDALAIKTTIAGYTAVPGMSAYTVPQEKRQALLDTINGLGKQPVAAVEDY